jgi:c-di-AMP phosphodiesterase-like protein
MMNNSTKINKTNNYLSYQTNEHKKYHKLQQKAMKFQVLAWDRHNNVAWLNQLIPL